MMNDDGDVFLSSSLVKNCFRVVNFLVLDCLLKK
jgi:hypothetical protein